MRQLRRTIKPLKAMPLHSSIDPDLVRFCPQRRSHARAGRGTPRQSSIRWRAAAARPRAPAYLARQDAGARARRSPDRSRHRLSRIVAAGGLRPLWRRRAFGEHRHRRRADLGPRMRDRRQRCHHQGRHLLSDDGEEASARPGHRAAEQSALRLHGRFRRRVSAAAGRDFPGRAAFRPHLLQPGADVGARHSADRDRDGLVHRGRRLCAGDVGREHHRAQSGHDLSRRAAAGEGRDRRGGHRRRTRRRRCAFAAVRRHRSLRAERQPCDRHRAADRRHAEPPQARRAEHA